MDWDKEFEQLTGQLADISTPEVAISLSEIALSLERINEAAMHVSTFMSRVLANPEEGIEVPESLVLILPILVDNCEEISHQLHGILCDCDDDDDDDDFGDCDEDED